MNKPCWNKIVLCGHAFQKNSWILILIKWLDMQGTTYILKNHVHILKYFIQLKYYTVNCLQRACVWVCVRVCVCVCVCFQNSNNSQLHKRTESSGLHGNANDHLLRVGYHRRWLEFIPLSQRCWVHLEMPTMIIVACSWVSSLRNSVGNRL